MEGAWDWITGFAKEHLSEWSMVKVYLTCAIVGGTVILGQTGLTLFGIGDGDDVDPDVSVDDIEGMDGSLNVLSIRALSGFLTFFGLVGWTGTEADFHPAAVGGMALAAGLSVMLFLAWAMRFFQRLQSSGNLQPDQIVGQTARVYLRIPGEKGGKGKITVSIQGRSSEFEAVTSGAELASGSECRIVRMITKDTFEVAALD